MRTTLPMLRAVEPLMNIPQPLVGDVGVDLGGRDVLVAKEFLHASEVGAVGQEISRIRVAEGMGGDFFGETGRPGVFRYHELDRPRRKAAVVVGL